MLGYWPLWKSQLLNSLRDTEQMFSTYASQVPWRVSLGSASGQRGEAEMLPGPLESTQGVVDSQERIAQNQCNDKNVSRGLNQSVAAPCSQARCLYKRNKICF